MGTSFSASMAHISCSFTIYYQTYLIKVLDHLYACDVAPCRIETFESPSNGERPSHVSTSEHQNILNLVGYQEHSSKRLSLMYVIEMLRASLWPSPASKIADLPFWELYYSLSIMPPSSSTRALNAILPQIASSPYEAHQKARTFASRYIKSSQYDTAIDLLFQSSKELLKTGQAGSGVDLAGFMLEVYDTKEEKVSDESRGEERPIY